MNIFWKKLFGGITSTSKFEKQEADFIAKMRLYYDVQKSAELAEYQYLKPIVTTSEFRQNKKILLGRKYKETEEFQQQKAYKKIMGNGSFHEYLKIKETADLQEFLAFRDSDAYTDLADKLKVKNSPELKKMKLYERSKAYKTYLRYNDSFVEKEYFRLREVTESADFKARDEFWKNPKRWETTEDYTKDARYYELAKNPDILFFLNTSPETFEPYKTYCPTFVEEFPHNTVDASLWDFGFYYPNEKLLANHSFANEQQANNAGANVSVQQGVLHLATKKEKVLAAAWDEKKGFVEKEFDYTADAIHTANSFRQKCGFFRAKIRVRGAVNHSFWLSGDGKLPHVNIFHFNGKHITVGNANETQFDKQEVTGISPSDYYIYSLLWTEKELVWYINNLEVYRTKNNLPNEALYLSFNSFIPQGKKPGVGTLEVDWVRVYNI